MLPFIPSFDRVIQAFDSALRTAHGLHHAARPNPAAIAERTQPDRSEAARLDVIGMTRVNHTGEICAQALYQGQALVEKDALVRAELLKSAREEEDHLAWTAEHLDNLGGHKSYLNPLWYGTSFAIGAFAGRLGKAQNLGFLVATEEQVESHLDSHLARLPAADLATQALFTTMRDDEKNHAAMARSLGAGELTAPIHRLMALTAKVMTWTAYRL